MYPCWVVVLFVIESAMCQFPRGFRFGAATAAYQVEGAWNVGGRTPSIWDEFTHKQPERIQDRSTGDVACDSYHLWKRDIEMAKELGLHFYRFSISWNRLFPNGFINKVNEDGVRYYGNLINGLIENRIEPVVTLFHWDLPQNLQDLGVRYDPLFRAQVRLSLLLIFLSPLLIIGHKEQPPQTSPSDTSGYEAPPPSQGSNHGGWTNPLISEWFADYARAVYSLYADRIKTWITINEPLVMCDAVYYLGLYAPGIISPGIGNYICIKNVLVSHAKAWRIYDEEFRPKYKGKVAITNHHIWYEPGVGVAEEEADMARQLLVGLYTHPIYSSNGGWPPMIEILLANKSESEGYSSSRLPAFTPAEIDLIKGTYDFYGFNYYTTRLVRRPKEGEEIEAWPLSGSKELNITLAVDPDWRTSSAWWLNVYPPGIRRQLKWFKDQFGDIEIMITENGYAALGAELNDWDRLDYFKEHLEQVLLSIDEDNVNVTAYTAWSLMDNFEWYSGYTAKFGLYAVDFSSPQRTRTPRLSAHYYGAVIAQNSLNVTVEDLSISNGSSSTISTLKLFFVMSIIIFNIVK